MREEKRNLNISGMGSYPGGVFDNVRISGTGKIIGNLKCNKLSTSGTSKIEGKVIAQTMNISGSGRVIGDVEVNKMTISGTCKIEGDLLGEIINISGAGRVTGNIKCEKVNIAGAVITQKNIEAEEVSIEGSIKNSGFINAEKVMINTRGAGNGHTKFNEIGATQVNINTNQGLVNGLFNRFIDLFTMSYRVEGCVIEGDSICIEYTKVNIIRGNKVKIGPYCEVEEIEYKDSVEIDETSIVKMSRQI